MHVASSVTHVIEPGQLEAISSAVSANRAKFQILFSDKRKARFFVEGYEVAEGVFDFYLSLERELHGRAL